MRAFLSGVSLLCLCLSLPLPGLRAQTAGSGAPGAQDGGPLKPAKRGGAKLRMIGEGSYEHPSSEAADAWETQTRQDGGASASVPTVKPSVTPDAVAASAPLHPAVLRPRPAVARSRREAAEPSARSESDRRPTSLWDGLNAPMQLSPQRAAELNEDQAAALGRQDYDSHILGQREAQTSGRVLPAPGSPAAAAGGPAGSGRTDLYTAGGAAAAPEVFVSLSLDLKNHPDATLKDAVADLGRVAGFRQDGRFEPAAVGPGPDQVSLWGWLPSNRVGAALKVASVARLEVTPQPRRLQGQAATDMLVGVRLPAGVSAAAAAADLERDLDAPGLRVLRTIGLQTAPGTSEAVLVFEASVPISLLPRLMAHPRVLKMVPAPQSASAAPAPALPTTENLRGFMAFVVRQSPLLLVLTLLMLLPWASSAFSALARVFVPYR